MIANRRRVLGALGALAIAGAAPAARARAPLAGTQGVSVHRMKLGAFEVTTLLDGFIDAPIGVIQGDADRLKGLFAAAGMAGPSVRLPVNAFLVNTGDRLVLIDTGGARMLGPTAGRLPQALAQAGIEPAQVDEVYITHMHGDHLHGAVTPEGARLFPNATVRIARPDLDFWGSAAEEAKAPENQKGRFVAAKRAIAAYGERIVPFALGDALAPGIRSIPAAGHTPGHSCYMVESAGQRLLLLGDTIHVTQLQFANPDLTMAFDSSQADARAKRRELFEMVARERVLVGGVHIPFPGIGLLKQAGAGFAFEPVPWQLF